VEGSSTQQMKSRPREREAHIFEREAHGHYVEPGWCAERLLATEDFGPKGSAILDPCAGWCRIPRAIFAAGYMAIASDIVDRIDEGAGDGKRCDDLGFIHKVRKLDILAIHNEEVYSWWRQAKSIISNPPFDQIYDVARRCVALAEYKVALICPLRRLPAAYWLKDLPLKKILLISPRPSMPTGEFIRKVERGELDPKTGKPLHVGGGTQDFVWLIFEKEYKGEIITDWLFRDGPR
jgi:hypothetical protein